MDRFCMFKDRRYFSCSDQYTTESLNKSLEDGENYDTDYDKGVNEHKDTIQ